MSFLRADVSPSRKKSRTSDDENDPTASSSGETHPDARGVVEPREVIEIRRYEYLDHPADIQLHSWGSSLEDALSASIMAMYGYMTDLSRVDEVYPYFVTGRGHDLHTAIFSIMEEALCAFQSEPFFVAKRFEILLIDRNSFVIEGVGYGESFDLETKHSQEGDVKAITYSNMQVKEEKERTDLYVIVDI